MSICYRLPFPLADEVLPRPMVSSRDIVLVKPPM
jgi:hypothetical protein